MQSPERLPAEATVLLIVGAVDFVVFLDQVDERHTGGPLRRFVGSVREVLGADGTTVVSREVPLVRAPTAIGSQARPASQAVDRR